MAERQSIVGGKSKQRSRMSNGTIVLPDIDNRTAMARRIRELLGQFVSDMGGDPAEAKRVIAMRAATLTVWCESAESKMANGEEIDISIYTTAANSLRRLLVDIGLERRARDITGNLSDYVAKRYGAAK